MLRPHCTDVCLNKGLIKYQPSASILLQDQSLSTYARMIQGVDLHLSNTRLYNTLNLPFTGAVLDGQLPCKATL